MSLLDREFISRHLPIEPRDRLVKLAIMILGAIVYIFGATIFGGFVGPGQLIAIRAGSFGFMAGAWVSYILELNRWAETKESKRELFLTGLTIVIGMVILLHILTYVTVLSGMIGYVYSGFILIGGILSVTAYLWVSYFKKMDSLKEKKEEQNVVGD